jgi:phenylalanyl-tRNA synthetase beta chain
MPAWRGDLLHPVDIVEDIIIGMGLSSLPDKKSQVNLPGSPLIDSYTERRIRQSIRALGAHEVQTLTLTNDIREFQDVRTRPRGAITRIRNPITKEHGILRQNILPSLMEVLAANRHHELPHRIFELGATVIDHSNSTSVAWACADANAGFSTAKGFCMSLLRDLGANENNLTLVEGAPNEGPWLAGRVAKVMIGDIHIGTFGEVDPSVSHKFGLRVPIHAGEFYVNTIVDALPDPLFR